MLAHLAEMAPYWLGEIERVLDGVRGARAASAGSRPTTVRIGLVERDRSAARRASCTTGSTTPSTRFDRRWRSLTPADLARRGVHPKRGEMTVAQMPDPFIVGHLEDHVDPDRLDPRGRGRRRLSAAGTGSMFILYAIPIGIVAGLLVGGRLDGLGAVRLHWVPLILLGLLLQVAIFSDTIGGRSATRDRPSTSLDSDRVRGRAAERRVPGVALIAIGAGCNLAAIVANGGWMPADPAALAAIGGIGQGYTNSVELAAPALGPLTDLFALPAWLPFANVFSVGDVLIGVGVAATIALAMRGRYSGGSSRTCVLRNARIRSNASRRFSRFSQPCPSSSYHWTS